MNCAPVNSYHWLSVVRTRALFHCFTSKMAVNDAYCNPSIVMKKYHDNDYGDLTSMIEVIGINMILIMAIYNNN